MNRKKYLVLIPIFLGIIIALFVRSSFDPIPPNIDNFEYIGGDSFPQYLEQPLPSPEEILSSSELIVSGIFTGNRHITKDALYSEIIVTHTYKGTGASVNETLYVIESIYTFSKEKSLNPLGGLKIPLKKDSEYVFFLAKRSFNENRVLNDMENKMYYPITESSLGYYLLTDKIQTKLIVPNQPHTLNELNDMEVFVFFDNKLSLYLKYKSYLFSSLKIANN